MDKQCCMNCRYFFQHYTFNTRKIFRVHCGHCTGAARPKSKKPDAPACEKFSPKQGSDIPFVSKEYLSRELLKYVLELELLPEIDDNLENNRT